RSSPSTPRSLDRRPDDPGLRTGDSADASLSTSSSETLSLCSIIKRSSSLGEQLPQERRHPRAVGRRRVLREPALEGLAHLVAVLVAIVFGRGERTQTNLV